MAERSFKKEVESLRLKNGDTFRGEGILAVTKSLLECGVSYVGGYQGSPISHLIDVFSDAKPLLDELGVYFEQNASEAAAAAMLSASVMYPIRGAVTWKSTVGTNVASDALANLASGGVTGGSLIIVGEDYGEGSSIMQERSHAFAMKSQIWLLDPRPNLPSIVKAVEDGFLLSEASNTPVILQLRIRSCHLFGEFVCKDNIKPKTQIQDWVNNPIRDASRVVLPPASFLHEHEKEKIRFPNAIKFIKEHQLNEFFLPGSGEVGIIVQGGLYNNLNRALVLQGLSDHFGNSKIDTYVLNVAYPLIDDEVVEFAKTKKHILLIEEGQPNYIEQNLALIFRQNSIDAKLYGKDVLPYSGEYTTRVVEAGIEKFLNSAKYPLPTKPIQAGLSEKASGALKVEKVKPKIQEIKLSALDVPARPAGFCVGCPERPIFAALKIVQERIGEHHVSGDIGCHIFSILPPFNIGATTMGYGLGASSASAFNKLSSKEGDKRAIAFMGDGGFWHNGLSSGITNAVFNNFDGVIVIVDNHYSAATGGQDIPSSRAFNLFRTTNNPIEAAVRGVGVKWVKTAKRTYDVNKLAALFNEALTTKAKGPKVIIAQSECMLNRQRREKPIIRKQIQSGIRTVRERFGVDGEVCTGDHACIRLSGCPSLSLKYANDPLREDPIATIDSSCVACGNCGEVAEEAILCPSFYKAEAIENPSSFDQIKNNFTSSVISYLQDRRAKKQTFNSI